MALTTEALKTIATGVSDEVLAKIAEASIKDEQIVIDAKVAEIHNRYDADIKEVTGEDKPGGVKTYEHLKNVLKTKVTEAAAAKQLQLEVGNLKSEKKKLEDKIAGGEGAEVLNQKIADLDKKLRDKEGEVSVLKGAKDREVGEIRSKLEEKETKLKELEFATGIDEHLLKNGIKFKKDIPESILGDVLKLKKQEVLREVSIDEIENGSGGKMKVLRNKTGEIIRNGVNPMGLGEYFITKVVDLVDTGRKAEGGGSSGGSSGGSVDLGNVKTQIEADEMIGQILAKKGLTKTNPNYQSEFQEMRKGANVASLPLR